MNPFSRIFATEMISAYSDISAEWKIAAVEYMDLDGTRRWDWQCKDPKISLRIRSEMDEPEGSAARLSAVQGLQRVGDEIHRCLYVRRRAARSAAA